MKSFVEQYRRWGVCFIPMPYKSKAANIRWEEFQRRFPTDTEIASWFSSKNTNMAIVCGGISGNLVALDCDTPEKYYELKLIIENNLGLDNVENHTPVVKTGKGYHTYFRTKESVKSTKFPKLDIKGEGGYVLAPPSIHPNGTQYRFLNPNVKDIFVINSLNDIGIDLEQKPQPQTGDKPNWISEVLQQGVDEGQRNDTCFRLAGYFKERQPQDITTPILLAWNRKNHPPLSEKEVITAVDSAYTYAVNTLSYINSKREDSRGENAFSLKSGQVSGQVVDNLREYGVLATAFDKFLRENPEPHYKRDIAEFIGTTYKDPAFIKLVQRRSSPKEGVIRILHGGDKIQWVNRDWRINRVKPGAEQRGFLGLHLPFAAEKYIAVPEHCQIVLAGDVGAGKSHWAYALAELNLGKLAIRHFFNEMGSSKAQMLLDDFPELQKAFNSNGDDYALINLDAEPLDVAASLDPNGLNIYDWLHLPTSKEWFLVLQKELTTLSQRLETGVVVILLQKKRGQVMGYGGDPTRMQSEVYLALNIERDISSHKEGRLDIIKCRDWTPGSNVNPEVMVCSYKTGGLHGKLLPMGDWFERSQE